MAIATDPQTLANASACYECGGDTGRQTLLMLGLLASIAKSLNPVADVSPQGLMNQANCYLCTGGPGTWQLYMLALLAIIAQNSSGVQVIAGSTSIPGAGVKPTNTSSGALYYFTDAGGIGNQTLFQWNIGAQIWTQLI